MKKPIIALTMGDPAGIGAELTLKVAMDCPQYHLVAVGDMGVLTQANRLLGNKVELLEIQDFDDAIFTDKKDNQLIVYQAGIPVNMPVTYGKLAKEYGMAAYNAIITAIDLAMQNKVQAVVTNPINKESLHLAGILQAGHTEIFAQRTQTERYSMLLVHGPLKVAHISTHVSLRKACDLVSKERVLEVLNLVYASIKHLEGASKPIAVAGLNPHAGEHGLFGDEEIQEIIPAINEARLQGLNVEGPFPPDTIFSRAMGGEFSAVIAMYHDQGHIPLKLAGFQIDPDTGRFKEIAGVNITLGLPIIRTSVDHGTAFDIAGTGKAQHQSLQQAIAYAIELCSYHSVSQIS